MQKLVIFTLGHSNRKIDEFLELLKINGIEMLVDIRRFPTSKWEQFKKENLKNTLEAAAVGYEYLGTELWVSNRGISQMDADGHAQKGSEETFGTCPTAFDGDHVRGKASMDVP